MYRSILVATDGSEYSSKAVKHAALLARTTGARLVLFHAAPHISAPSHSDGLDIRRWGTTEEAIEDRDATAHHLLTAAHKGVAAQGLMIEEQFSVSDHPYEAILDAAKRHDCDLIVMAPHGLRGMAGILIGSETQKVLAHSKLPVLVVR